MKDSSAKQLKLTKRAPYQPVTRLEQVPIALQEIRDLARHGKSADIVPLISSVIAVTMDAPNALATLPHVANDVAI